jgi:prepilin-type N-terminal cleavage/methylation domain-containing protein
MRKALTMIELIISMVIIGIVFTVIPRLVIAMNQNAQTTIKEEALYNALSLMGSIVPLSGTIK